MKKAMLAVLVVMLATACASTRGVEVGTDAGHTIRISNTRWEPVTVTYSYNKTDHSLGTVDAVTTERFVVAGVPDRAVIWVSARSASGAVFGPYSIQLNPGTLPTVTVR